MVMRIFGGAPMWVWPVLVALVVIGLRAMRARDVPVWPIYLMPLAGILSVKAVFGLHAGVLGWAVFVTAYCVGMVLGQRIQGGIVLEKMADRVRLRGEWITFVVLMVVFWMSFVGGVTRAVSPEIYSSGVFQSVFAAIAGLTGGSFAGRSLYVWRL